MRCYVENWVDKLKVDNERSSRRKTSGKTMAVDTTARII